MSNHEVTHDTTSKKKDLNIEISIDAENNARLQKSKDYLNNLAMGGGKSSKNSNNAEIAFKNKSQYNELTPNSNKTEGVINGLLGHQKEQHDTDDKRNKEIMVSAHSSFSLEVKNNHNPNEKLIETNVKKKGNEKKVGFEENVRVDKPTKSALKSYDGNNIAPVPMKLSEDFPPFQARPKIPIEEYHGKTSECKETKEIFEKRKTMLLEENFLKFYEDGLDSFNSRKYKILMYPNSTQDVNRLPLNSMYKEAKDVVDFVKINEKLGKKRMESYTDSQPISAVATLRMFKLLSGLENSSSLFSEDEIDFEYFRVVLNDGNGFYRAVMFSIIEQYILLKNVDELKKLTYNFHLRLANQLKGRNVHINKSEIIGIMYMIIELLEKDNNPTEAYKFFLRAYYAFDSFDLGLIKYMRLAVAEYLYHNLNEAHQDFIIAISDVSPLSYVNGHHFNYNGYIDETILNLNTEADKLVMLLTPLLFNINIKVSLIETTRHDESMNTYKYKPGSFSYTSFEDSEGITINLFKRFGHIDILYHKDFYKENFKTLPAFEYPDDNLHFNKVEGFYEIKQHNFNCTECHASTQKIQFYDMLGEVCLNCVKLYATDIIEQRVKFYISEQYFNKEYYCRPIRFKEFLLTDYDIYSVFNKMNIGRLFKIHLTKICLVCHAFLNTNDIIKFNCGCVNCQRCLTKKIKRATNGLILLSSYEQRTLSFPPTFCSCSGKFDLDHARDYIFKDKLPELELEVSQRLNSIVLITCYECLGCVSLLKKPPNFEFIKISSEKHLIKPEAVDKDQESNGRNTHVICHKCFETNNSMKKVGNKIQFQCKICNLDHYADPNEIKKIKVKRDNPCCLVF